jgi:peptidoglycan/LPS O-acetylase OafA/YrhL
LIFTKQIKVLARRGASVNPLKRRGFSKLWLLSERKSGHGNAKNVRAGVSSTQACVSEHRRMNTTKGKYSGLEVVRGLAALLVVYNHTLHFGILPKTYLLELPAQFATEAVIIFFVLSGTVITLSAERKSLILTSRFELLLGYLRARFLRIYPIYILGLAVAALVHRWLDFAWPTRGDLIGNALFLQSLSGYIVPVSKYNLPLWSLSNEIFYYVLFGLAFLVGDIAVFLWMITALLCAIFLYPPGASGTSAHLVFVLALSLPWLMGHWIAKRRHRLPLIPVPLGFAFFAIGLCYARIQLTSNFFDVFRLTAFAACCCPLILSLIQKDEEVQEERQYYLWRFAVSLCGIAALWAFSPSPLVLDLVVQPELKIALTGLCFLFSALRIEHIRTAMSCFSVLVPALVYIGSISYALYALHAPMIFIVNHVLGDRHWVIRLAVFACTVASLSHFMERVIQPRCSLPAQWRVSGGQKGRLG